MHNCQSILYFQSEYRFFRYRDTFFIWIYVYLMVQLAPTFMINGTILILIQSISLFWMAMVPGVPPVVPGVYISQLIRFIRASSNLSDFNYRKNVLTEKLLRQAHRYFKLCKAFSKFDRRHSALEEKYNVSLKTLLQQGISEREFYGDLVYRFRKIVGKSNFSEEFRNIVNRYKRTGYSLDIMRQSYQPYHFWWLCFTF